MNVVIVPCFKRPGFLQVMLELLEKARGYEYNHYLFAVDLDHDPRVLAVINQWANRTGVPYEIRFPNRRYSRLGKQSYNVISSYRHAVGITSGLVHLIEDDIFVADDYFEWHSAVHLNELVLKTTGCTIASVNNCHADTITGDLGTYYYSYNSYQSLGVCWAAPLLKYVLGYIDDIYFENPITYCAHRFPNSSVGPYFAEQDGLIRRILERDNIPVAFPHHPRCYHAGFQGYNRYGKKKLPEDIPGQVELIREICFDTETMAANAVHPEHIGDSVPVPLENKTWKKQNLYTI